MESHQPFRYGDTLPCCIEHVKDGSMVRLKMYQKTKDSKLEKDPGFLSLYRDLETWYDYQERQRSLEEL